MWAQDGLLVATCGRTLVTVKAPWTEKLEPGPYVNVKNKFYQGEDPDLKFPRWQDIVLGDGCKGLIPQRDKAYTWSLGGIIISACTEFKRSANTLTFAPLMKALDAVWEMSDELVIRVDEKLKASPLQMEFTSDRFELKALIMPFKSVTFKTFEQTARVDDTEKKPVAADAA